MTRAVFGIAKTVLQAEEIVSDLKETGFSNTDISALFPGTRTTRGFAHQKATEAPEGQTVGAGAGSVVGGAIGWLAGIAALAIPGGGPLIAAGPILDALSGAAAGAAVGGLAGAFVGLGVPQLEAERYEGQVREGNILISVHAADPLAIARAKIIFIKWGASDVSCADESMLQTFPGDINRLVDRQCEGA